MMQWKGWDMRQARFVSRRSHVRHGSPSTVGPLFVVGSAALHAQSFPTQTWYPAPFWFKRLGRRRVSTIVTNRLGIPSTGESENFSVMARGKGRGAGGKRLQRQNSAPDKRLRVGAADVRVCRACKAQHGSSSWPSVESSDSAGSADLPPITDQCPKCLGMHSFNPGLTWNEFAKKYQDDPSFREQQDRAYDISQGKAAAEHQQAERRSHFRVGFRLEKSVLALTAEELRTETEHIGDIKHLKVPMLELPGLAAAAHTDQPLYALLDAVNPYRRVIVYAESEFDADTLQAPAVKDFFEGQARNQAINCALKEAEQRGLKIIVDGAPSLGDVQALAKTGGVGSGGSTPNRKRKVPASEGGGRRKAKQEDHAAVNDSLSVAETPAKTLPEAASSSANPLGPSGALRRLRSSGNLDANSVAPSLGGNAADDEVAGLAALNTPRSVMSGSCHGSPSAGRQLSQDELRKLAPHEKARYWTDRLDIMAAMCGRSDRRVCRQVEDMLDRYKNTPDQVLAASLSILRDRLAMFTKAEGLAPNNVVTLEEESYKKHIEDFLQADVVWPLSVQEGFIGRKVRMLNSGGFFGLECFKVVAPWRQSASATDDADSIFDPLRPTVWALDATDARKVEVFRPYFVFGIIKAFMGKQDFVGKMVGFLKDLENHIGATTKADVDLSDEAIDCIVDVLTCTRALRAVLTTKVDGTTLTDQVLQSFQQFRSSPQRCAESVCAQVHGLAIAHAEISVMMSEFIKREADLRVHAPAIAIAADQLIERPIPVGSMECHKMLASVLGNILQWEMTLRQGAVSHIADALRARIIEHADWAMAAQSRASANASEGEQPSWGPSLGEVLSLVEDAWKVWTMCEDLTLLKDRCRKAHLKSSEEATSKTLDAELRKYRTMPKIEQGQLVVHGKADIALGCAIDAAKGYTFPKFPEAAAALLDALMVLMNEEVVWNGSIAMTPVHQICENVLTIQTMETELKDGYAACFTSLLTAYDVARSYALLESLGRTHADRFAKERGMGLLHGLRVHLARFDKLMENPPNLPSIVGDWTQATRAAASAKEFVADAAKWHETKASEAVREAMAELMPIARGGTDGNAWSDLPGGSNDWPEMSKVLSQIDLEAMDGKIKKCEDKLTEYKSAHEMLGTSEVHSWLMQEGVYRQWSGPYANSHP